MPNPDAASDALADGRTDRLLVAVAIGLVVVFIALGAYQIGVAFQIGAAGSDHFIYSVAVDRAWRGEDPYLDHRVGWSYLYPPPSLLLLKAIAAVSPSRWPPAIPFMILNFLGALVCIGLLIERIARREVLAAILLLTSAGLLETLWVGQINGLVIALVASFLWAWRRAAYGLATAMLAAAICLKLTPIVFALFYAARQRWRWLPVLGAWIGAAVLLSALLIPAPHLAGSFVDSLRWMAAQGVGPEWNYSLGVALSMLLRRFGGVDVAATAIHLGELALLAALLARSYASYARDPSLPAHITALFVAANLFMVLSPNVLWLHHLALAIPALWLLLVETDRRSVPLLTVVALVCFQSVRCLQTTVGLPPSAPCAVGQLALIAATVLFLADSARWGVCAGSPRKCRTKFLSRRERLGEGMK